MIDTKSDYRNILEKENSLLDEVLVLQQDLRNAVNEKDWTKLMSVISSINLKMDSFNHLDEDREKYAASQKDDSEILNLLSEVRGKLVRTRTENKALGDYINITRNFVQGIIDTALPQSRAKVYSRSGSIVRNQPQSVVVNQLY